MSVWKKGIYGAMLFGPPIVGMSFISPTASLVIFIAMISGSVMMLGLFRTVDWLVDEGYLD